ncbi:GGDEF domain-containing protein [Jannaschia sp. R86511]|uniref:GGDEF domain-containing protein n=1 Tax=Jannaschia sp. R86511 TaxID=3093853 RepID=UPI0036D229B4
MDVFAPRDPRSARRSLQAMMLVVAAVLAAYTLITPPPGVSLLLAWVVVAALLLGAAALVLDRTGLPRPTVAIALVLGVVVLAGLDIATDDASAAAQVFFLLPVVFAAAHLRRAAAWTITAVAMAGEAVTTLVLLPVAEALTDTAYLSAVAVITTSLLVRANRRTDDLLAELRHLAAVDPLTGLVTRRVLDDAASCALTAADAEAGTSFVLFDVDRFKGVNDHFGHPVGDTVLVHVARVLTEVAGTDAVVSRIGGDELAVLLPGTSVQAARHCAELVGQRLRQEPVRLDDGRRVAVTVSVGVAHAPDHAVDLAGLYRAADTALYEAKRGGRDQVAVARPGREAPVPAPRA